ncbi:hypothetical protein RRG08_026300 [Elysia crispata]|uniref:Uncharacterized protein n=1 Tax=Elysia crispata TaxID=231223 RepID=A0AAE0ZAI7_9GAST|nr:hypothetical protein RRG08_026300 [Elysia crispata]
MSRKTGQDHHYYFNTTALEVGKIFCAILEELTRPLRTLRLRSLWLKSSPDPTHRVTPRGHYPNLYLLEETSLFRFVV